MFKTVSKPAEIRECQEELLRILNQSFNKAEEYNVGFPGGNWKGLLQLNDDIWLLHHELGEDEISPRYWNAFGLTCELNKNISNNIVVELNIPTTGVNRRVAGFFAKDKNGRVGLFHRGKIGGGRKGIGKQAFLNWASYELTSVLTDGDSEGAILVGIIGDSNFTSSLHQFLLVISKFKLLATSGYLNDVICMPDDELLDKIINYDSELGFLSQTTLSRTTHARSEYVKEYALRVANGICQLCENEGPFMTQLGRKFLEVHHVAWLSNGGADILGNVVALCPNCHRKMHIINDRLDVARLKSVANSARL
ncbi:HNH endonuclease [Vibrio breoganii]